MASTEPDQRAPGQEKQCDGFASRRSDPYATPGDTNMSREVLEALVEAVRGLFDESRLRGGLFFPPSFSRFPP